MEEDYDWIRAAESRTPKRNVKSAPAIDQEVTKAVGTPVAANDPRLIRLVVKWKGKTNSSVDGEKLDNFMHNPGFLAELKETFA